MTSAYQLLSRSETPSTQGERERQVLLCVYIWGDQPIVGPLVKPMTLFTKWTKEQTTLHKPGPALGGLASAPREAKAKPSTGASGLLPGHTVLPSCPRGVLLATEDQATEGAAQAGKDASPLNTVDEQETSRPCLGHTRPCLAAGRGSLLSEETLDGMSGTGLGHLLPKHGWSSGLRKTGAEDRCRA